MSSHVLDVGEKEEAYTIVHTATKRLRDTFKYIDRKLDKEEPGFAEFQKLWGAAKSLSNKVSPHPNQEWLNKFGEYFSSDSVESSTSESDNEEEMETTDLESTELEDRPPIWILYNDAASLEKEDRHEDGSSLSKQGEEEDTVLEKAVDEHQNMSVSTHNNDNLQVYWQGGYWKNIDPVVLRAVRAFPGGFYLSPAALHFLCEQVTLLCLSANQAHGKLYSCLDDQSKVSGYRIPWECTLEMCYALSSVPIHEQILQRAKSRMKRILSDKKERQAASERRKLKIVMINVLTPRFNTRGRKLSEMVDLIHEHFGSIERLFKATHEELATIPRSGHKIVELLESWQRNVKAKCEETPAAYPSSQI